MGSKPSTILEISSDVRVRFSAILTFEYTKTPTSPFLFANHHLELVKENVGLQRYFTVRTSRNPFHFCNYSIKCIPEQHRALNFWQEHILLYHAVKVEEPVNWH